MKKVAILMGSDSDAPVMKSACDKLKAFGVDYTIRIISAHRTPEVAADFAKSAADNGYGVVICAAGMAAHLAGAIAANTTLPVIGVPIKSTLDGLDALLSTVQMPPGIPVATVGINNAVNASLLAVQILAVSEPDLAGKLKDARVEMAAVVSEKDSKIQSEM